MDRQKAKAILSRQTTETFARRMAAACNEIKSSHVYFIVQQAYPEIVEYIDWGDCEELFDKILSGKE